MCFTFYCYLYLYLWHVVGPRRCSLGLPSPALSGVLQLRCHKVSTCDDFCLAPLGPRLDCQDAFGLQNNRTLVTASSTPAYVYMHSAQGLPTAAAPSPHQQPNLCCQCLVYGRANGKSGSCSWVPFLRPSHSPQYVFHHTRFRFAASFRIPDPSILPADPNHVPPPHIRPHSDWFICLPS